MHKFIDEFFDEIQKMYWMCGSDSEFLNCHTGNV